MSNWIQTTFNVSGSVTQAIAVILALAVVLLLFGLFILILKRLTGAGIPQNRNRQPRIAVMDSAPVDTKRRLVLIRRDNIEHLILVGGPSDVVVEQNIIRNAPLTSPRQSPGPSSYTGAGLAGSGPIKSPMAPGPDIPVKPDDHMPDSEPETLAALAAPVRTPVIATEPEPEPEVSPVPPAAPGTPAAATAPVVPERPRTPPAPPRPSVQTRPAPATPPRAVRTERKSDTIDTGNETGRAADLLRAATQNGFNRAFARTPAPAPAPAPDTSAGAHRAPEVKSGQATSADHAAASTDKPSSEVVSPARPVPSRDRPSYVGHSITPPASGPAARAKTALMKPAETQVQRIEPVVAPPALSPRPTDSRPAAVTERPPAKTEPEPMSAQAAPALAAAGAGLSVPGSGDTDSAIPAIDKTGTGADDGSTAREDERSAAGETSGESAPAPTPEHETSSASEKEPAQVEPEVQAEVQTQTAPEPATGNAGDDKPGPEESAEREIVLDLDDLIADTPPQATASPDQDEPAAAQDNTVSQDQSQTPAKEASSDEEPRDDQVRPAARPAPTLSEKNPIEEEMAKILDELGGQPN